MPQPTLQVIDANSVTQTISTINPNGAATVANSQAINIASDQVNLLSSSANQTTANTALAAIQASTANIPSGGATASLQTTGNTSLATIATNSGTQSTAANQTTGNTSLSTIATAQGAQGTTLNPPAGGTGILGFLSGIYNTLLSGLLSFVQPDSSITTGNITTQDIASTSSSGMFSSSIVTGTPTANSSVSVTSSNYSSASVTISGTWTGTIATEVSEDGGTHWVSRGLIVGGTSQRSAAITSNVVGSGEISASTNFRCRATTAITGTASISIKMSQSTATVKLVNGASILDNASGASGTVKLASTLPVFTDTAVVTTLRDAATVGDGTNNISVATVSADTVSLTQNRTRVEAVLKSYNASGAGGTLDMVRSGITSILSSFIGFLNNIPYAIYNSTPITLTNGQGSPNQCDSNGFQLVNAKGQRPFEASVTITRPGNTTAYVIGQVINSATSALTAFPTFALGIGNSMPFWVQSIRLVSNNGSVSVKLQPSVMLFNAPSPSGGGFNDASTFNATAAALFAAGNCFFENVPATVPNGTAAYCIKGDEYSREGLTDVSGNVYVALIAQNAYIPANAETLTLLIKGVY